MATATQNGEDLFRQAIGAWESAVESGVKMQEQSAKCHRAPNSARPGSTGPGWLQSVVGSWRGQPRLSPYRNPRAAPPSAPRRTSRTDQSGTNA